MWDAVKFSGRDVPGDIGINRSLATRWVFNLSFPSLRRPSPFKKEIKITAEEIILSITR